MTISKITDHAVRAKRRLPRHFDGALNLQALIDITASRNQDVENILIDLLDKRALSTAKGKQLDNAGTVLNIKRIVGETNSAYRTRLYSGTSELGKSGEVEHLIEVFSLLTTPASIFYQEMYPATALLTAHTDTDPVDAFADEQVRAAMKNVKAGGVGLYLTYATATDYLSLSDKSETDVDGNGPIDPLHGLGDEILTEGGAISRAFGYPFSIRNLAKHSSDFSKPSWGKIQVTVEPNAAISPDGTLTADKIVTNGTADPYVVQNIAAPISKGNTFTESFWLWTDSDQPTGASLFLYGNQYTTDGMIISVPITLTTIPVRYELTIAAPPGVISTSIICRFDLLDAPLAGDYLYVWGAQLRKGIYPGPYVETNSTQVTRIFNGN